VRNPLVLPNAHEYDYFVVQREVDLLRLVGLLVVLLDPDLVGGWDIEQQSVGYVIARAHHHSIDILALMGRA
jgi:DNA polymerase elongation subunit (family B)